MASSSFRAASSAVKQSSSAAIRRFAFPGLHVGTDICQVSRIYAILAGPGASASRASPASHARSPTRAARLVRRILTPQELPDPGQAEPPASLPPRPSSTQLLAWLLAGDGSSEKESSTATATATATDGAAAPLNSPLWKAAQFLAGRFAAKEAAIKAHPHLDLSFHQVRIVRAHDDPNNGSGPPVALVQVPGTGGQPSIEQEALLSISHDGDYATAVCLGFQVNSP